MVLCVPSTCCDLSTSGVSTPSSAHLAKFDLVSLRCMVQKPFFSFWLTLKSFNVHWSKLVFFWLYYFYPLLHVSFQDHQITPLFRYIIYKDYCVADFEVFVKLPLDLLYWPFFMSNCIHTICVSIFTSHLLLFPLRWCVFSCLIACVFLYSPHITLSFKMVYFYFPNTCGSFLHLFKSFLTSILWSSCPGF